MRVSRSLDICIGILFALLVFFYVIIQWQIYEVDDSAAPPLRCSVGDARLTLLQLDILSGILYAAMLHSGNEILIEM